MNFSESFSPEVITFWIMRTVICPLTMWNTTKPKISTERSSEMHQITCIAFSRWCEYVEEF